MHKQRRQHNALTYWMELCVIRVRDRIRPPGSVLLDAGVRAGMTLLDFGCGPGGFSLAAAQIVGPDGLVYAIDIRQSALTRVRRAAARRGIGNIRPILASHISAVPEESVDMVLLYDVLHIHPKPTTTHAILRSIHRVLKPDGALSVSDHHLQEAPLLTMVTGDRLFRPAQGGRRTFRFEKIAIGEVTP